MAVVQDWQGDLEQLCNGGVVWTERMYWNVCSHMLYMRYDLDYWGPISGIYRQSPIFSLVTKNTF